MVVGERVEFEVEVSEEGAHVMWSVFITIFAKTGSTTLTQLQSSALIPARILLPVLLQFSLLSCSFEKCMEITSEIFIF